MWGVIPSHLTCSARSELTGSPFQDRLRPPLQGHAQKYLPLRRVRRFDAIPGLSRRRILDKKVRFGGCDEKRDSIFIQEGFHLHWYYDRGHGCGDAGGLFPGLSAAECSRGEAGPQRIFWRCEPARYCGWLSRKSISGKLRQAALEL